MTDPRDRDPEDAADDAEDARRVILARRARFVAAALASAGIATASCAGEVKDSRSGSDDTTEGAGGAPQPCLSYVSGGGPQVCLSPIASGGDPQVCLSFAMGGAYGAGGTPQPCLGAGGVPMPCLSPPPPGGQPQVCLEFIPDAAVDSGSPDGAPDAAPDAAPPSLDAAPLPCLSLPAFDPGSGEGS